MADPAASSPDVTVRARHDNDTLLRQISVARILAKFVLFVQALVPASLWLLSLVALFIALSWFGVFRMLPDWARIGAGLGFLVGLFVTALPVLRLHWPDTAAADTHLEAYNHLPHQAIAVQEDQPASGSGVAHALWREHQNRMAKIIRTLDVGAPSPDLPQHDPYGLRAAPVLLLAIAFAYSNSPSAGSLLDVFTPHVSSDTAATLRIDAWITPPAYTGSAPIYLTSRDASASDEVSVPQFSVLTVQVSGQGSDAPVLFTPSGATQAVALVSEDAKPKEPVASPTAKTDEIAAKTYQLRIEQAGDLAIGALRWTLNVQPDEKPVIAFDGNPRRSANGSLEISFKGHDDFGFAEAHADIVAAEDNADAVALYPLPDYRLDLPRRDSRDIKGVTSRNLTEHPMAGTRVRITLVATDGAGQTGRSEPVEMTLPARNFQEPLAASLVEQRQVFSLDANQVQRALDLSAALTVRAEETIPNSTHFLFLQSARSRIALARSLDDLRSTADYIWQMALQMEDGEMTGAERNLRDAQQALSEALARNAPDAEIKKLMDELRKAMTAYLDAMKKRLAENPGAKIPNTAKNMLREKDLQKMLDQLENLARSGSREEAQKLLNEMQRMMNNLQAAKPQGKDQKQNGEMSKQIDKLGELLQNQQKLMDQTFALQQQLEDRMQRGDPNTDDSEQLFDMPQIPGEPQDPSADDPSQQQGEKAPSPESQMTEQQLRDALKELQSKQDGLGKDLEQLNEGLKGLGAKPGKGFGQAKKNMGEASKSLGQSQGNEAVQGQGKALQALREGAKDLLKQMQGQGGGEGQGQAGAGQNDTDPLGRQRQTRGESLGEDVKVPDEIDIQKAREILDAIRKKLGSNPGPELERQYLERLLDIR